MRLKTCRQCKAKFVPAMPLQTVCGPMCGLERAKKARLTAEKKQDRAKRESLKTISDLKAEAQKEVNAFVRARDEGLPCISCGKQWQPTFQAGHYRTRGAAGHLALDPRNIAGQCVQCNLHKHGNQAGFRAGLVVRHGEGLVESLENDNEPIHWERDVLRQIKTIYRAKTRALKKEKE